MGTAPNKNLANVIMAIAGRNYDLRIIGRASQSDIELASHLGIHFSTVAGLDDDQIQAEYEDCDVVIFVSTYEGFGLPIIEAQLAGRPVITSDIEPMRWVAGDGALLVDPFSVASITAAIDGLMHDNDLKGHLIKRGFQNVLRFDSKAIAKLYGRIYGSK